MGRFDDQYQFGNEDRGYRSDEVRGPTREQWSGRAQPTTDEREESAGGAGGYGNSQNPAWAGQSANLESDVAGRGSYGPEGTEGTSGYGRYPGVGGEGQMVSSPDRRHDTDRGRARGAGGSRRSTRNAGSRDDYGFGTRHWGHGEYQGSDDHDGGRHEGGFFERLGENIGARVGRFFGVGPKGYRRSDERIHEDVCETLQNHHDIDASEIEVSVKGGVVRLSGTVDERRTRRMVEDVIDRIPGIQDIENHLRTKNYVARTEAADQMKTGEADGIERPNLHS